MGVSGRPWSAGCSPHHVLYPENLVLRAVVHCILLGPCRLGCCILELRPWGHHCLSLSLSSLICKVAIHITRPAPWNNWRSDPKCTVIGVRSIAGTCEPVCPLPLSFAHPVPLYLESHKGPVSSPRPCPCLQPQILSCFWTLSLSPQDYPGQRPGGSRPGHPLCPMCARVTWWQGRQGPGFGSRGNTREHNFTLSPRALNLPSELPTMLEIPKRDVCTVGAH